MDPLAGRRCEGALSLPRLPPFPRTIARISAKPPVERFSFPPPSLPIPLPAYALHFYNAVLINLHTSLSIRSVRMCISLSFVSFVDNAFSYPNVSYPNSCYFLLKL